MPSTYVSPERLPDKKALAPPIMSYTACRLSDGKCKLFSGSATPSPGAGAGACFSSMSACEASVPSPTQVFCLGRSTVHYEAEERHACQHGSEDFCLPGSPTFGTLKDCEQHWPEGKAAVPAPVSSHAASPTSVRRPSTAPGTPLPGPPQARAPLQAGPSPEAPTSAAAAPSGDVVVHVGYARVDKPV